MTERPILMSAPMVRAILAGTKTQTRQLVRTREQLCFIGGRGEENEPSAWGWHFDGPEHHGYMVLERGLDERHDHGRISIPCPYGQAGDRLWVKETWAAQHDFDAFKPSEINWDADWHYTATEERGDLLWRSPISMPRWASRITLEIVDVRVQRVQDISEADAWAEGIDEVDGWLDDAAIIAAAKTARCSHEDARATFGALWDQINGERRVRVQTDLISRPRKTELDRSGSWAANPWVWVLTFRRVDNHASTR